MNEKISNLLELITAGEWGKDKGSKGGIDIGVIRSANFTKEHQFNDKDIVIRSIDERKLHKKILLYGDILIEKSGGSPDQPVGRVLFYDLKGKHTCSNFISILRPSKRIESKFLYYALCNLYRKGIVKNYQQQTTGIINLQLGEYLREKIYFPPRPQQKKIVEILSGIDKVISEYLRKLNKHHIIAESINESIENRYSSSNFSRAKIADISTKVGSGITPRGGSKIYLKKGVKLIRSQNVLKMKLSLSNVAHIPDEIHQQMHNSTIYKGDTLLNISGASIGRSAVVPSDIGDANVNQHVCIIRTTEKCNPYYLSSWLNSQNGQKQINISQAGGNRQGLNFKEIRSMSLPLHTREFQNQVAHSIFYVYRSIENIQRKLTQLRNLKSALSSDLLTGQTSINV